MIHLSIIFSEDYIIQLERPFLINSTMYLFLWVKYFSDALILLDTVFLFQILLISLIIYIKVIVNLQFNNLEALVIEKWQYMFLSFAPFEKQMYLEQLSSIAHKYLSQVWYRK